MEVRKVEDIEQGGSLLAAGSGDGGRPPQYMLLDELLRRNIANASPDEARLVVVGMDPRHPAPDCSGLPHMAIPQQEGIPGLALAVAWLRDEVAAGRDGLRAFVYGWDERALTSGRAIEGTTTSPPDSGRLSDDAREVLFSGAGRAVGMVSCVAVKPDRRQDVLSARTAAWADVKVCFAGAQENALPDGPAAEIAPSRGNGRSREALAHSAAGECEVGYLDLSYPGDVVLAAEDAKRAYGERHPDEPQHGEQAGPSADGRRQLSFRLSAGDYARFKEGATRSGLSNVDYLNRLVRMDSAMRRGGTLSLSLDGAELFSCEI